MVLIYGFEPHGSLIGYIKTTLMEY